MSGQPDYYAILGVDPMANAVAIEAAYHGRMMRFRVGRFGERTRALAGPSQDEVERAYAVLSDPEERARYDATRFPERFAAPPPAPRRRTPPPWLLGLLALWFLALGAIAYLGLAGLAEDEERDDSAIGRLAAATITATRPAATATQTRAAGLTLAATATATSTVAPPTATTVPRPTPTATPSPAPTATVAPTAPPTATATVPPPPTATPPPAPTEAPVEPPPPDPTPTPAFRPTDRIGTSQSVHLRGGPGADFPSLGLLPTGTLLRATGEQTYVAGVLWRRFTLQDGRNGWVRDIDVLPVR